MRGAIPPHPQYPFTGWCLVKHSDDFTFIFYLVDWIRLAQDRDQWRYLVNTVVNLRIT